MTERQAFVARHPFIPGAFAYLNAKPIWNNDDIRTLERWLAQGATVAKVPLDQAVRELQEHIDARRMEQLQQAIVQRATLLPRGQIITIEPSSIVEELPIFLRKQAD